MFASKLKQKYKKIIKDQRLRSDMKKGKKDLARFWVWHRPGL